MFIAYKRENVGDSMQPWMWMSLAIFLEVLGTVNLKLSDGMSKIIPSLLIFVFYGGSFFSLSVALKQLDVGVAYAVWAGAGTALIATISFLFLGEPMSFVKVFFIGVIIAGVFGLNLVSDCH